ncbi:MAG: flagellar export chaperone FlgN [Spirochaetaceae bacterium]
MNTASELEKLKYLLKSEVELLEDFARQEQELQNAIVEREWDRLEGIVNEMTEASQSVLSVEQERHECYTRVRRDFDCPPNSSFYDFAAKLDLGDRMEISELYRRLKVAVMRVQALTGGIGSYITSATSAIRDVLDELYPQRKGRIYSRAGHHSVPDDRAMVVDHHL